MSTIESDAAALEFAHDITTFISTRWVNLPSVFGWGPRQYPASRFTEAFGDDPAFKRLWKGNKDQALSRWQGSLVAFNRQLKVVWRAHPGRVMNGPILLPGSQDAPETVTAPGSQAGHGSLLDILPKAPIKLTSFAEAYVHAGFCLQLLLQATKLQPVVGERELTDLMSVFDFARESLMEHFEPQWQVLADLLEVPGRPAILSQTELILVRKALATMSTGRAAKVNVKTATRLNALLLKQTSPGARPSEQTQAEQDKPASAPEASGAALAAQAEFRKAAEEFILANWTKVKMEYWVCAEDAKATMFAVPFKDDPVFAPLWKCPKGQGLIRWRGAFEGYMACRQAFDAAAKGVGENLDIESAVKAMGPLPVMTGFYFQLLVQSLKAGPELTGEDVDKFTQILRTPSGSFDFAWRLMADVVESPGVVQRMDVTQRKALKDKATHFVIHHEAYKKVVTRVVAAIDKATLSPPTDGAPQSVPSPVVPARPLTLAPVGWSNTLLYIKQGLGLPQSSVPLVSLDAQRTRVWEASKAIDHNDQYDLFSEPLEFFQSHGAMLEPGTDPDGHVCAGMELTVESILGLSPDRWDLSTVCCLLAGAVIHGPVPLARETVMDAGLFFGTLRLQGAPYSHLFVPRILERVGTFIAESPLTEGERFALACLRDSLAQAPLFGQPTEQTVALNALIADDTHYYLSGDDFFSRAVNGHIASLPMEKREPWAKLIKHVGSASSAKPSDRWLGLGKALVDAVGGPDVLVDRLIQWLPLNNKPRKHLVCHKAFASYGNLLYALDESTEHAVRALLWLITPLSRQDITRAVADLGAAMFKKVPGLKARSGKIANACVWALGETVSEDALGKLGMLSAKLKTPTARKEVEKALNASAGKLGMSREALDEMTIPTFGLEEVGRLREEFDGYVCEMAVGGGLTVDVTWSGPDGKVLKSIPAKVKTDHADDIKELQGNIKDLQQMMGALRYRLEALYLKPYPMTGEKWMDLYLNHPLMGVAARQVIWEVTAPGQATPTGVYWDAGLVNLHGQTVEVGKEASVRLWHPIDKPIAQVKAWRKFIEDRKARQPFKQAHREVYVLTPAELETVSYSNRFAGHIIRQQQFNALCAARSWKHDVFMGYDGSFTGPWRNLEAWGLRVEYDIHELGLDDQMTSSGAYIHLATDKVSFTRTHPVGANGLPTGPALPEKEWTTLPLANVPAIIFSELMRDVDLFVGVSSIGNDPNWADHTLAPALQGYWEKYSFGELAPSAQSRKEALEQIIPRLAIAGQCSFTDRFLVVQGKRKTYKIHLGSGNILMEPGSQYLCIVANAREKARQEDIYLPFDGDATLSIILSKALLLARDEKITDPSILSQIKG